LQRSKSPLAVLGLLKRKVLHIYMTGNSQEVEAGLRV